MASIQPIAPGVLLSSREPLADNPLSHTLLMAKTPEHATAAYLEGQILVWAGHAGCIGPWAFARDSTRDLTQIAPLVWLCDACVGEHATGRPACLARRSGDTWLLLCVPCAEDTRGSQEDGITIEALSSMPHAPQESLPRQRTRPAAPRTLRLLPILLLFAGLVGFLWAMGGHAPW